MGTGKQRDLHSAVSMQYTGVNFPPDLFPAHPVQQNVSKSTHYNISKSMCNIITSWQHLQTVVHRQAENEKSVGMQSQHPLFAANRELKKIIQIEVLS